MNKLIKYAQHFAKLELMKARLGVFQNEIGRKGSRFYYQDQCRLLPRIVFMIKTNNNMLAIFV